MAMKGPLFFAKILLFGEYGIIKDSKGLSIPYNYYRGALKSAKVLTCLLYTSPSPRDRTRSRMPSSA